MGGTRAEEELMAKKLEFVKDIMTSSVTTVDHEARLLDAALLMRSSGFRHVPVVDNGRLVGIISDRDVKGASPSLFAEISQEEYNRIFETTPVAKVMTKDPKTVTPDATLKDVVAMMQENKFGAVPIVEGDNKLVGIVTSNDMLALLRTLLEQS